MKRKEMYINRELSWLDFNHRVLHEVLDAKRDPIGRLFFSAIFSNNLDEFFMIRVGGLLDQIKSGYNKKEMSGLTTEEQLKKIREKVLELTDLQADLTNLLVADQLKAYGVIILDMAELNGEQFDYIRRYFDDQIYPVLTPMAIDLNRPFPLVGNKSLNILFKFQDEEEKYATLQVPSVLPRLLPIDRQNNVFVLLEDVIMYFSNSFFEGLEIVGKGLYRPTRNADIALNEEVAEDLLVVIEESLKKRKRGGVVRLEVEENMPVELLNYLVETFECTNDMVYFSRTKLDLTFLFSLSQYRQIDDVFTIRANQLQYAEEDLFEAIKARDYLLHHPYDSFDTVTDLIDLASKDPNVLAIKQVLYRVSGDSPIVKSLARAANLGKQVTVVLELMARFDEANNIQWAKELEKHGCHVIFGLQGMKTHAKITLIVRREVGSIQRYIHLSSGNYNDKTARIYTDIGVLTADEQIAADASKFFNMLSGYTKQSELNDLIVAPKFIKPEIINMIQREIYWAKQGIKARIVAKFNALVDQDVIDNFYEASQAGVEIVLIIRGICCLVPGKKKLSENIKVISVVDDLLEHSRVYWFSNNGKEDVLISSADCMPRNLIRRVELMIPIKQTDLKNEIIELMQIYIDAKPHARYLCDNGHYISAIHDNDELSAQKLLVDYYKNKVM